MMGDGGRMETTRTPLGAWPRDVLVAVATAYRDALGEGRRVFEFWPDVLAAYRKAGGDAARESKIMEMIAAVARDHPGWLYGPARRRIEREDGAMAPELPDEARSNASSQAGPRGA